MFCDFSVGVRTPCPPSGSVHAEYQNLMYRIGTFFFFQETVEYLEGGVPKGAKTSDFYKTDDIPTRFQNPGMAMFVCLGFLMSQEIRYLSMFKKM